MQHRMISHDALKSMSQQEIQTLSQELRDFLVQHMAKTGGHLASNLGIVELTLAIHTVYDTEKDRLLFDVGHQSYVHKILTGRHDQFSKLRTFGGLSGFPKPSESIHDPFIAGHASDSVSVAVGMARARTLSGEDYHIVAVLGDGALTGGLAYEGLNDAGESGEPLVVVLNDNGMSITPNVGAVSKYLALARLKPGYFELKKWYRQFTQKVPGGNALYKLTHRIKTYLRKKLIGVTLFEEMGFQYLGPVDGHDVEKLTFLLREAKEMKAPVLLHVITQKGRGYAPAEMTPAQFHGVGKFDPETGNSLKSSTGRMSFSDTFGKEMCDLASRDSRICAITAAMEAGTGLGKFAETFPSRYFDVGIAEGHAVCMAAGLAKQGMLPVFAVYSTFLQRGFDMLIHDVSLLNLHVVFAVDRAGLVGEDGETHHGAFDVGYLRQVPGMQLLCPINQKSMSRLLHQALYRMDGPVAIRYPKGCDGRIVDDTDQPVLQTGENLTIVTYGIVANNVLDACDMLLKEHSVTADVICPQQISPFDMEPVLDSVRKTGRLLVVEDTAHIGCIGTDILAELTLSSIPASAKLINMGTGIVTHGDLKSLYELTGLDAKGIYYAAKELIGI